MKFFQKANIRLLLTMTLIVFVSVLFAGRYFMLLQKDYLKKQTEIEVRQSVEQLKATVLLHESDNLQRITAAERIALLYLREVQPFTELPFDSVTIPAVIDQNGGTAYFRVSKLMTDEELAYKNIKLVDKLRYLSNAYVSIWQKTDKGYLRITSNLQEAVKEGSVAYFMHNGSPMVQTIESGKRYYERKSTKFDSEYSVYLPLVFEGYIKLIIQITINEGTPTALKKIFEHNRFFKDGKMFFLNQDDSTIINTELNRYFKNSALIKKIKLKNTNFASVENQIYEHGKKITQIVSFSKLPLENRYAGIILTEDDFTVGLWDYMLRLVIVFIFVGLFLIFSAQMLFMFEYKFLNRLDSVLGDFSVGKYRSVARKRKYIDAKKESIVQSVNLINNYYQKNANYAQILSRQDYGSPIEPAGDFDVIGNSLLKLKSELLRLESEQAVQNEKEKLREKINAGNRQINAILQYAEDSEEFYFGLIKELTRFLEVQQAGLFIVEEADGGLAYLELKAHFAFDEKRVAQIQVGIHEGLIGRCYLERKRILLKEIPENYTKISSGFGHTEPKNIVLVPLIFNNKVHGVIEISSVTDIEEYKIEFLENVGENIASTLSNISNTRRTAELLEQTKSQAEQIETQRKDLQERIDTHRRQNKNLDKQLLELQEIIGSIKKGTSIIEFDLDKKILSLNERVADLLKMSDKDLVGKSYDDIFVSEDVKKTRNLWKDLKDGKSFELKDKLKLADGTTKDVYVHYISVRNARRRVFRVLAILSVHH